MNKTRKENKVTSEKNQGSGDRIATFSETNNHSFVNALELTTEKPDLLYPLFDEKGRQIADALTHQTGRLIKSELLTLNIDGFGAFKASLGLPCCFFKYDLNPSDFIGLELSLLLVKRISQFFKGIDSFPELPVEKITLSQSDVILLSGAINHAFSRLLSQLQFNGEVSDVILVPDKMVFCSENDKIMIARYQFSLLGNNQEAKESHGLNLIMNTSSVIRLFPSVS
ncbi:MAG: hypothetical protein JXR70_08500 [Spirochaetales bacterium]|nr:hypothetical protein [Spirochaetales bacterium]